MTTHGTAPAQTPGPWTISNRAFSQPRLLRSGKWVYRYFAHVRGGAREEQTVAHAYGRSPEEAVANARLIAAAPDLRTASQQLYDALQNYLIDVPDRDLPRWLVEGMDAMEGAWQKADGTVLDDDA
jgi:hypothetical protein